MKGLLLSQIIITLLLYLAQLSHACTLPFVQITDYQATYCVKCDTTCANCFEDNPASCTSCPADFTFNDDTSYCIPPNTAFINTIESSYKWPSFSPKSGWTGHGNTAPCGSVTLLSGTGSTISWSHDLQPHFKMRLLVSLWEYTNPSPAAKITFSALAPDASVIKTESYELTSFSQEASNNNSRYCTGSKAKNIDITFNGDSTSSVTL